MERPMLDDDCLECVGGGDGVSYQLTDWSGESFIQESCLGAIKDDDTTSEDVFDV